MTAQRTTRTRSQRITKMLATSLPACTSLQYKHEYYKIFSMAKELLDYSPKDAKRIWIMTLLDEALQQLSQLDDPTSTPTNSRRQDSQRWTDISLRRIIAEAMFDERKSVSFYDCYEALREGRSKAAQLRLCEQVRQSWETVTGMDQATELSFFAL